MSASGGPGFNPDVWLARWRTVIPFHAGGVPSMYWEMGSSRRSFPCPTRSISNTAVNILVPEAIWNAERVVAGTFPSRFAVP